MHGTLKRVVITATRTNRICSNTHPPYFLISHNRDHQRINQNHPNITSHHSCHTNNRFYHFDKCVRINSFPTPTSTHHYHLPLQYRQIRSDLRPFTLHAANTTNPVFLFVFCFCFPNFLSRFAGSDIRSLLLVYCALFYYSDVFNVASSYSVRFRFRFRSVLSVVCLCLIESRRTASPHGQKNKIQTVLLFFLRVCRC